VQGGWSAGAIEQHGNARVAMAHLDNDPGLPGQFRASSGAQLTHLKTSAGNQSGGFLIHPSSYSIVKRSFRLKCSDTNWLY
jgi:hypothetical protein